MLGGLEKSLISNFLSIIYRMLALVADMHIVGTAGVSSGVLDEKE
jgi:hypothetical protein